MPHTPTYLDFLPLELLLDELKELGFDMGVDTYERVHQLINQQVDRSDADLEQLKYRLSALLAKSEAQQELFFRVFEAYVDRYAYVPPSVEKTAEEAPASGWKWAVGIGVILGFLLLGIWVARSTQGLSFAYAQDIRSYELTVSTQPPSFFGLTREDVSFAWKVEGQMYRGEPSLDINEDIYWSTILPFDTSGTYQVVMFAYEKSEAFDSLVQTVKISPPELPCQASFTFVTDSLQPLSVLFTGTSQNLGNEDTLSYEWDFGDQTSDSIPDPVHLYAQPGPYPVELRIMTPDSSCFDTARRLITLVSPDSLYIPQKVTLPGLQPIQNDITDLLVPTGGWQLPLWVSLGLLLAYVVFEYFRWNRRKLVLDAAPFRNQPFKTRLDLEDPTIDLFNFREFYEATRDLRARKVGRQQELDIDASIRSTIQEGGFPALRYKQSSQAPEYLILIEQKSANDLHAQLFASLTEELRSRDITAEFYFYEGDPKLCWRSRHQPESYVSLEELQNNYAGYRLLVVGDGAEFFDLESGQLALWAEAFSWWEERALLSTRPTAGWDLIHRKLSQVLVLVPDTISGIGALVSQWKREEPKGPEAWQREEYRTLPPFSSKPEAIPEIRAYLGEADFQWLCACAVYPELRWRLTLKLGQLLANVSRRKPDSTLPNWKLPDLPRLKRLLLLPWFRQGRMPNYTREVLLEHLHEDFAFEVRQYLIEVLNRPTNKQPVFSYAEQDREVTLAIYQYLNSPRKEMDRRQLDEQLIRAGVEELEDHVYLKPLVHLKKSPSALVVPTQGLEQVMLPYRKAALRRLGIVSALLLTGWLVWTWTQTPIRQTNSRKVLASDQVLLANGRDSARFEVFRGNQLFFSQSLSNTERSTLAQNSYLRALEADSTYLPALHNLVAVQYEESRFYYYLDSLQIADSLFSVLIELLEQSNALSDSQLLDVYFARGITRLENQQFRQGISDLRYFLQKPVESRFYRYKRLLTARKQDTLIRKLLDQPATFQADPQLNRLTNAVADAFRSRITIEGGRFQMGSQEGGAGRERPAHPVEISDFMVDVYEVTNYQYQQFLHANLQLRDSFRMWVSTRPEVSRLRIGPDSLYRIEPGYEDHPVTGVSWYGANAYARSMGARLPTEAEWEFWVQTNTYSSTISDSLARQVAWIRPNSGNTTHPVGTLEDFPPATFDWLGNVAEWMADWYSPNYYQSSPLINPAGPEKGSQKVVRGGSFASSTENLRITRRTPIAPSSKRSTIGFRTVSGGGVQVLIGDWGNRYEEIGPFYQGRARVKRKGLFGYVNLSGEEVIRARFQEAGPFSNGLAWVKKGNKFGYIDAYGNTAVPFGLFDEVWTFRENRARVGKKGRYGYLDSNGMLIISRQYGAASDFVNGQAQVQKNGRSFYLDLNGRCIRNCPGEVALTQMVRIPADTFRIGTPLSGRPKDESTRRQVYIPSFSMDQHEVTLEQYAEFLTIKRREAPDSIKAWIDLKKAPLEFDDKTGKFTVSGVSQQVAVTGVTWYGAKAYAQWAGKRLPTEAEWEYAARSRNQYNRIFSGSNLPETVAWYSSNSGKKPHVVKTKTSNSFGLYDLSGNVQEW
ncbi:MAG: SUMF1/EgtB/PvdO family nonheme iron enzyme, partial [Bacteroidota bacterium]